MKLKGLHMADVAAIQEAVTDELKKVQKEEFSPAFQKLHDCAKACIYANRILDLKKKSCVVLICFRLKKKLHQKRLDRTV
jgi:ABC-type phosphate/phosphonate transport system ATPase subunit